jgi:hypothetical protein
MNADQHRAGNCNGTVRPSCARAHVQRVDKRRDLAKSVTVE